MRSPTWMIAAVLLAATLSVANGGQPPYEEETYNSRTEATKVVDGFLRTYRSGLTDSLLLERIGRVREWSITLREIGDRRLVKPLSEVIADTAGHSDKVTACAISVLQELRAQATVPAIRRYLDVRSKPESRLQAAAALAVLGDAEHGVPVLREYGRRPEQLSEGYVCTIIMDAFFDNSQAARLRNPVQESIVTSYFQEMVESGQNLALAVCYLLQKDEQSREIAFRIAEDVLRTSAASKGGIAVPQNLRGYLRKFGGERGEALSSKYQ